MGDDEGSTGDVHPQNQLNELSGREWMYFTKSVLRTSYPSVLGHDLRRRQGGNKPPQLMRAIIEFFTKRDGLVLDPFAGAGGTMLGAHLAGRRSVGLEINPRSVEIYRQVCQQEGIVPHPVLCGDCEGLLDGFADDAFDLVATDPPYSIRLRQTMSGPEANANYNRANRRSGYVEYSDHPADLSNLGSFDAFYAALQRIGAKLHRVLRPRRYLVLILRDAYQGGEYIATAYRVAERFKELGFTLKGIQVWYATGSRIRPYGYPHAYVPNIIHQNVVIMRKEGR